MGFKKLLKMCIVTLGLVMVLTFGLGFMGSTINALLIIGAIMFSLIAHYIPQTEKVETYEGFEEPEQEIKKNVIDRMADARALKEKQMLAEKRQKLMDQLNELDGNDAPPTKPSKFSEEPDGMIEEENELQPFVCKRCGKKFDKEKNLKRHIGMAHYQDLTI